MKRILNTNYQTLIMMAADAPRYMSGEKNTVVQITSEEQLSATLAQKYG